MIRATKPLPFAFIRKHVPLSWTDALWGHQQGLIDWHGIKELAATKLSEGSGGDIELELACITESDAYKVDQLVQKLATLEPARLADRIQKKWLFLLLTDLYLHREERPDALADVETLYADFGYPEEIEGFVRYMPATDGYDPQRHSHKENQQRMYRNWGDYLAKYAAEITKS